MPFANALDSTHGSLATVAAVVVAAAAAEEEVAGAGATTDPVISVSRAVAVEAAEAAVVVAEGEAMEEAVTEVADTEGAATEAAATEAAVVATETSVGTVLGSFSLLEDKCSFSWFVKAWA